MEPLAAIVPVVVGVVSIAERVRTWLRASSPALPPGRDDGVAVVRFETDPVRHPSDARLRMRHRAALALLGLCALLVVTSAWTATSGTATAAILLAEALLILPSTALRVIAYRGRRSGDPVCTGRIELDLAAPFDAVAARVRRAFLDLGAMRLKGTRVHQDEGHLAVEGGTGEWGFDRDAGYRLRVTATRTESGCSVVVEAMNYVPSLVQGLRNRRNILAVLAHLAA